MALKVGELFAMITADSTQFDKVMASSGAVFDRMGTRMTNFGKSMMKKVTAPIAGIGVAASKSGMDIESSFNKVKTIMDKNVVSYDKMQKGVMGLSQELGVGATEINEALYQTISATGDTQSALDYVGVAAKAAMGGFTDAATAVDGLSTVMNAYKMNGVEAMQKVSDQMLMAQNYGKTTFGEMSQYLGQVIPIAASMNVGTKELFASVGALTKSGIKTGAAMTGMKAALSNIIKPTKDASEMASELGINFSASHLKSVGWAQFLSEIKEKTSGNTDALAALFGSVEALNTVTVLATTGSEDFAGALAAMDESAGSTQDAFDKMNQGGKDAINDLFNTVKNVGGSFYSVFQGPLENIIRKINDFAVKILELDEGSKQNIVTLASWAAGMGIGVFVLGKLFTGVATVISIVSTLSGWLSILGGMLTTATGATSAFGAVFTIVTGPIGIAIAAIAGIILMLVKLSKKHEWAKESLTGIWEGIKKIFSGSIDFIVGLFTLDFPRMFEGLKKVLGGVVETVLSFLFGIVNAIWKKITWVFDKVKSLWAKITGMSGGSPRVSMPTPTPNMMESGGITTGPVLTWIGEGVENEAVLPLSKLDSLINVNNGKSETGDVNVYVTLDSQEIASEVSVVQGRNTGNRGVWS